MPLSFTVLLCIFLVVQTLASLPPIHYTISRRGGIFPSPDTTNLTYLLEQLKVVENRFDATTRDFNGNKIVRKPKRSRGTQSSTVLLGEVGRDGNWFATFSIGEPAQHIDVDLDMLTADWRMLSANIDKGSFFWDFNSKTYVDSEQPLWFPTCREPKDIVHLPTIKRSVEVSFANCRPAKQYIHSLLPSGMYLGLAPSKTLSQIKTKSFIPQLIEKNVLDVPIWSLMLINGREGLFSIGGTSISSVRQVEKETDDDLAHIGAHEKNKRDLIGEVILEGPQQENLASGWNWSRVQGADGWWQVLMSGVWVDGLKVLRDQPIVLDINTPFVIAPPLATRSFYSSISGSRKLDPPYDQFHAYPCFNPPKIHFEFAGWNVEVLKGKRDPGITSPGGKFSLGRMAEGSGYCIGMIVESRIGLSTSLTGEQGTSQHVFADGGNGLADVWIVGETFFRDVNVAFDWKEKKVGMQKI